MARQDRIRERAYAIWVAEGCPADRHVEHWLRAEREVADPPDGPVARGAGPDETVETISQNPRPSIETLAQPAPEPAEMPD